MARREERFGEKAQQAGVLVRMMGRHHTGPCTIQGSWACLRRRGSHRNALSQTRVGWVELWQEVLCLSEDSVEAPRAAGRRERGA